MHVYLIAEKYSCTPRFNTLLGNCHGATVLLATTMKKAIWLDVDPVRPFQPTLTRLTEN